MFEQCEIKPVEYSIMLKKCHVHKRKSSGIREGVFGTSEYNGTGFLIKMYRIVLLLVHLDSIVKVNSKNKKSL